MSSIYLYTANSVKPFYLQQCSFFTEHCSKWYINICLKVKLLIFINEDTEQVTQFTIPVPKKTEYINPFVIGNILNYRSNYLTKV